MSADTYATGVRDIRNDLLAFAKNGLIQLGAMYSCTLNGNLPIIFFEEFGYLQRNRGYLFRQMKKWESLAEEVNKHCEICPN